MKYTMLLWPHANVRYQNETLKLAEGELRLMLDALLPEARIAVCDGFILPALQIEAPGALEESVLASLRAHSLMYGLFEQRGDGSLLPVAGRSEARVGADLPGILKYKGKTNEMFMELLTNAALYSSGFAHRAGERLELLDPMFGRGTELYVAANRGWNAAGTDVDRRDLGEAERFLKHYFEFHRMKHGLTRESRTVSGKSVPVSRFEFAGDPGKFHEGDRQSLRLANADAARARDVFGREKFHMIVCDLPYGVQHGAVGGRPEELLQRALPAWREALKKGGTVALSFNAQTLRREKVLRLLEDAGFEAKRGGAHEGFSHWVEQAVTRDIAVGRRQN